ncbi:N-formylglutamate deformylase [Microvirga lotononidis]|uniref:N-formylglutamate amidohydrolase n=1 Tax=Microvirga lotononidis TaxID=864069 RepID=I4Z2N2_9HYPH|nr:N-formylglutamate deformylase [Microvirga lotononidis]EIM30474.1 N-formylglutamate amidohydrolase [Microvirga lotononidis]WQO26312.1 N-formylglutamate deformylase [Microvirga lotononidis]
MSAHPDWLTVSRGDAPLVVSLPHTGTEIPDAYARGLVSPWLARKDADWWIDRLYDFAPDLGATVIRTAISRTVIDVNRDPSGVSLYPGQATTELCPTTTFDGEPLYQPGAEPTADEIAERRARFFDPYHAALRAEIERLRAQHDSIVVYDCHSIRSVIPRLFDGTLPHFNIGTNGGASCAPSLSEAIESICVESGLSHVLNGRFKGGYITRSLGRPAEGVHAVQMELACRGYMHEPLGPVPEGEWPSAYDAAYAAPMRATLTRILQTCLAFDPSKA